MEREDKMGEKRIAAILNPILSSEHICQIVELIYANEFYTLSERLKYAKNKNSNPYRAEFDSISGIPFEGRIICGHNPYLDARKVENLHVVSDENGGEKMEWIDLPRPDITNRFEEDT